MMASNHWLTVLAHPYGAGEIQAYGLFLRSRSDIAVLVCIGRNSQPRESVFEIISRMAKHICSKETLPTVYIYIMVSRKWTNTKQIAVFSEVSFLSVVLSENKGAGSGKPLYHCQDKTNINPMWFNSLHNYLS